MPPLFHPQVSFNFLWFNEGNGFIKSFIKWLVSIPYRFNERTALTSFSSDSFSFQFLIGSMKDYYRAYNILYSMFQFLIGSMKEVIKELVEWI